jgi:hypothetical protein
LPQNSSQEQKKTITFMKLDKINLNICRHVVQIVQKSYWRWMNETYGVVALQN